MDKPIDLGKLQESVMFYRKKYAEGDAQLRKLKDALKRAQAQVDTRTHNQNTLWKLLNKAETAVVDGARIVVNG